ncbi:Putative glucose-6-phosphate 1-epimerase [Linum perenne]
MEITRDCNGIEQVLLRSPNGASAKVNLHGGQVVSWRNERGEELLFTSSKVRNQNFEFRLKVALSTKGELMLMSRIRNVNGKAFSFSFGYHTHLSVSDISEVRIEGLETLDYLDNLCHRERYTEQGDAITFESELDRVYLAAPNVVAILDHERKRTYIVRKEGLPDFAVWNPWEKKSKAKSNFGDEEYKQMVCVDGAAIEKPITLKPGEEWTGRIQISAVPSSFCNL